MAAPFGPLVNFLGLDFFFHIMSVLELVTPARNRTFFYLLAQSWSVHHVLSVTPRLLLFLPFAAGLSSHLIHY